MARGFTALRKTLRRNCRHSRKQLKGGAIPKWLTYLLTVSPSFSNTSNVNSHVSHTRYNGLVEQIKEFVSKPPREDDGEPEEENTTMEAPNPYKYPSFNVSKTVPLKVNHQRLNSLIYHLPIPKRVNPLGPNEKWVPITDSDSFNILNEHADVQMIYAVDIPYWNIYCTGDPAMSVNYFEGYTYADIAKLEKDLGPNIKNVPAIIPLGKSPLYLIALSHSLLLPSYDDTDNSKRRWLHWACAGRKMGLDIPLEDPRSVRNMEERIGIFRNTPDRISKELVETQIRLHGINPNEVLANAWKGSTLNC